ncbi:helix-turn-helix transcriptional regulator [Rhodococcus rhodochrous]|uniref:helix-turn-helix transcriptional regulator n=1 Tax=Rhodococcus rhodochrous TaxID=1829 RepID=UPI001E31691B|nr:helix-turn-helix transcriptional regulator [Rhodococcus rhodochrous]MCD2100432.1 helix-turn-helix transcriptional regulator [Rhodococcus rhodochrous]MCD2124756.1 helix-turn-helix transcriptional regulator [Rhodococcus rhodochrous]MCQ4137855.1 helix-turn-helix transcriptional regulator [Rhodococcus rhodochrous]MDJ0021497.1 helix-turn-helix transcriptional regulator [Rhodococcus rhodochrous]
MVNERVARLNAGLELGEFLKVRRALVAPPESGTRRRVPGLRREEVAALAGVSCDYYTRLEQGRHKRPSETVLYALAEALQLDDLATRHLLDLARAIAAPQRRLPKPSVQRVRPSLHRLLDTFTEHPAFIRGRRTDVLAMNKLAALLLTDFPAKPARDRNLLRWALLDEEARQRYVDWEKVVSSMVGTLRLDAGRHPDDPLLAQLVGDLSVRSEQFRRWWADHRVVERRDGIKRLDHPLVGRIDVFYEALEVTGEEAQTLFVYSTDPGSESESKLRVLADRTRSAPVESASGH